MSVITRHDIMSILFKSEVVFWITFDINAVYFRATSKDFLECAIAYVHLLFYSKRKGKNYYFIIYLMLFFILFLLLFVHQAFL